MNFKKSNFLIFSLLLIFSFLFAKNALAIASYLCEMNDGSKTCQDIVWVNDHKSIKCTGNYNSLSDCIPFQTGQTIFWYPCPVAGSNAVFTCENTKGSNCGVGSNSKEACKQFVIGVGGNFQDSGSSAAASKAKIDAALQAKTEQENQAKAKAAKNAENDKAKNLHCSCNQLAPDLQCKDGFNTMDEVLIACNSCYAELGNNSPTNLTPELGLCPLGTKETGPFSCTCGSGDKASCVSFYTFAELDGFCPKTCSKGNGDCKIDTSDVLKSLQKKALILNPAGFAFGSAGVSEIIGKIIQFLLWPIGMFTMVMYIWAGFLWMTAQGNSENVGKAKQILVWTTLGVVITLASYLIVQLIFTEIL